MVAFATRFWSPQPSTHTHVQKRILMLIDFLWQIVIIIPLFVVYVAVPNQCSMPCLIARWLSQTLDQIISNSSTRQNHGHLQNRSTWGPRNWVLDDDTPISSHVSCMLPSGKLSHNGKSPFFMGKLTISMAIFNSYVSHNQRVNLQHFGPNKKPQPVAHSWGLPASLPQRRSGDLPRVDVSWGPGQVGHWGSSSQKWLNIRVYKGSELQ